MTEADNAAIAELRRLVKANGDGPVTETGLHSTLLSVWPLLAGSDETSMEEYKLTRAENLRIEQGRILFEIERHGATVHGSTRAELHTWCVDLDDLTATIVDTGWRQLRPTASRWTAAQADEAALQLLRTADSEEDHPGLAQRPDGLFIIDMSKWIPLSGFQRTDAGRRKRFRSALQAAAENSTWCLTRHGTRLALKRKPPA